MDTLLDRLRENLINRIHGPLKFRLIAQPAMAAILALRDGIQDERRGDPPYFWSLFTEAHRRSARVRAGLRAIFRMLLLGATVDIVYQLMVLRRVYPGEALIVVMGLVLVPYVVVRGPANRLFRHRSSASISPRKGP